MLNERIKSDPMVFKSRNEARNYVREIKSKNKVPWVMRIVKSAPKTWVIECDKNKILNMHGFVE